MQSNLVSGSDRSRSVSKVSPAIWLGRIRLSRRTYCVIKAGRRQPGQASNPHIDLNSPHAGSQLENEIRVSSDWAAWTTLSDMCSPQHREGANLD